MVTDDDRTGGDDANDVRFRRSLCHTGAAHEAVSHFPARCRRARWSRSRPPRAANEEQARAAAVTRTSTSTSTTTTSTSTTTTTAPPIVAPAGLGAGSRGDEVAALERQLDAQRYDVGKVDNVFDATTSHAVMAFQKVHGLKRTGRATQDVLDLVGKVGAPGALLPSGGATRVEVDLKRQVLLLFKGGTLFRTLNVSTGSGKRYCVDGDCAMAVTPGGSYKVFFRRNGLRISRLGKLYNPLYFNGGIAIHGAPSVPGYPASHGCVRIPMSSSNWFPSQVPNGTPVYVIGGSTGGGAVQRGRARRHTTCRWPLDHGDRRAGNHHDNFGWCTRAVDHHHDDHAAVDHVDDAISVALDHASGSANGSSGAGAETRWHRVLGVGRVPRVLEVGRQLGTAGGHDAAHRTARAPRRDAARAAAGCSG